MIIDHARIKNIPPSSPTSRLFEKINFKIIRKINSPIKIKTNAFAVVIEITSKETIKLIKNIVTPPKIELKTNFKIFLIGTIKIFPKINKKQIQELKDTKVVLEFQLTSNVRLNNLNNLDTHPLKIYLNFNNENC